ncbi:fluoride efflux transporter CrcB [Paenibacillus lautus]|uniref:fluoride efflux transporter CrcB n=1 Tax=Paenibacillus lautus TaxID=1401 RepID=UPI002DBAB23D|nr:fluoride efflux transporter CrcB [Paenibacillus lautus]MEC0259903.1 fluoride efflux transporter CrcB [Paenibacillus lautus]
MNVVAVGIGGFLGAISRYLVGSWIREVNGFPYGTLAINLAGCLFLAWFFTVTTRRWQLNPKLKMAIGTGFTGAFTTFSTFSVETLNMVSSHHVIMAIIYVLASVVGGLGLAVLGTKMALRKHERGVQ